MKPHRRYVIVDTHDRWWRRAISATVLYELWITIGRPALWVILVLGVTAYLGFPLPWDK